MTQYIRFNNGGGDVFSVVGAAVIERVPDEFEFSSSRYEDSSVRFLEQFSLK
jgi:hypothetical protein